MNFAAASNKTNKIAKTVNFLKTDIWRIRQAKLPRPKSFLISQLRVILLAFRGFNEHQCQLRASALTFYSLLSIVPVAAMAFGIAKGFGFELLLEKQLLLKFPAQQEIITQVINFAHTLLENTKGGVIAGIGVAVLFWTVVKVLGNVEESFNEIWGIKENRSVSRKFADYTSMMLICPVLIIVSSSVTVFVTTQLSDIVGKITYLGIFSPAVLVILKILPFAVLWLLFSFVYIFLPNTKVNLKSGILAGIVAGTVYQIIQWAYIAFQIGVAQYNAIYGSFAVLPLFLAWLQLSWLIVLFGAEISFAHQNVEMFEFEPDCLKVSYSFKRLLTLRVANLLVKKFAQGCHPSTAAQIAQELDVPIRLAREIIFQLVEGKVLSQVKIGLEKEVGYQPARDINEITVKYVIDALENKGSDGIPITPTKELETLANEMKEFSRLAEKSASNKLLKDI